MNQASLQNRLLDIDGIRYFESIGSTNDEALEWASKGAPDLSIVIADEQTAGKGRLNRKWFTPSGTALAFSIILRPTSRTPLSWTVGLAALSVADACLKYGLSPKIKWPNDILLNGKKTAGILIETIWSRGELDSLVIGIGVNVKKESVPAEAFLQFPATCLENELQDSIDREELLQNIIASFIARRANLENPAFLKDWENLLAFKGEQVQVKTSETESITGKLMGLETDGGLCLQDEYGKTITVRYGDVSLRPAS